MRAELHDGTILEFPDGTSPEVIQATVKRMVGQPTTANNNLGAQAGLFARSVLNAGAGALEIVTEPVRQLVTDPLAKLVGGKQAPQGKPLREASNDLADWIGLPKPDTPTQRTVARATEFGLGAMGLAGGAKKAADVAGRVPTAFSRTPNPAATFTPGVAQQTLSRLAANPAAQAVSGVGAGAGSQQARESGAGPVAELASGLIGGIAAPAALGGVQRVGTAVKNALPQRQQLVQQRIDQRINIALTSQGIDPQSLAPAMRTHLRQQVGKAMQMGDLDDAAIARLTDYTRLGLTPTRARLTLDPFDVTQEMNASKIAAATGARDATLPGIAHENNRRLISTIDDLGGDRPINPYGDGKKVMAPIARQDAAFKSAENALYSQARTMAGGDIPLQRKPVMDAIYERLAKENKIRFVPAEVQSMLDDISGGVVRRGDQTFEVPFDVNTLDSLKTAIATAQRSTGDGNVKRALSIIRDAIDGTPVEPIKREFGGNQVVTQAGAQFLQQQDEQAGRIKGALDQARAAAAERRAWQESAPIIRDALNPDTTAETFVQRHILSRTAGFDNLETAADLIKRDPQALEAVRGSIVQYLKDAAIGKGGTSATGNFSGRGMTAALRDIGDNKLALFFDAGEIETLKAAARAGSFEVFQPRGSAVNNSNTAAGVAGLLQGVSKYLKPVANKLPFGEAVVSNPLDNLTVWAMQRPATNIPAGLLSATRQAGNPADPLLMPGLLSGSLLLQGK